MLDIVQSARDFNGREITDGKVGAVGEGFDEVGNFLADTSVLFNDSAEAVIGPTISVNSEPVRLSGVGNNWYKTPILIRSIIAMHRTSWLLGLGIGPLPVLVVNSYDDVEAAM